MLLRKAGLGPPTWSPDGARIALVGQEKLLGPSAVYIVNRDGSGALRREYDIGGLAWVAVAARVCPTYLERELRTISGLRSPRKLL
jgi:hypothetical protein